MKLFMFMVCLGAVTSVIGMLTSSLNMSIFGLTVLVFAGLMNIADAIEKSKKNP